MPRQHRYRLISIYELKGFKSKDTSLIKRLKGLISGFKSSGIYLIKRQIQFWLYTQFDVTNYELKDFKLRGTSLIKRLKGFKSSGISLIKK